VTAPEHISCSDLHRAGPDVYNVLQDGLKALGWTYDINNDWWVKPQLGGACRWVDYKNNQGVISVDQPRHSVRRNLASGWDVI
jgi:hypothetical protein